MFDSLDTVNHGLCSMLSTLSSLPAATDDSERLERLRLLEDSAAR